MGYAGTEKGNGVSLDRKRAAKFIDQLGHNRVTLRCDNEPAIEALPREIAQARQEGRQTVPERPPVGESQSEGIIESAVELVASQARTLKAALEHPMGTRVPPDARILCWVVEFAAHLMNRCDIGSDGKTSLQRLLWAKGQHTDSGVWRKDPVHARQTSERRKVGAPVPPRSVCWPAELIIRGSGCHRAGTGDQDKVGGECPSRRDGTLAEYSRCEPLPGPQMAATMRSTSNLERRDRLRWFPRTQEKC